MPPADLTRPLRLRPIIVPKPWGGHRLCELGRHDDPVTPIGESWDVADLPPDATPVADPVSRVVGGPHADASLSDLLGADAEALLGTAARSREGRFPLLVKTLDAAQFLSVQVHPPRSLAPTRAKTESWVVLDADAGAELLLGVRDGVTPHEVRGALGTDGLVELLRAVPVAPGDVVHVPAGTIHALGPGVLVSEVQTPSDITHRLWDWPGARDGGRPLHLVDGMAAIEAGWEHNLDVGPVAAADATLVATDAYRLDRWTLADGEVLAASTTAGTVRICIVLRGGLRWNDEAGGQQHLGWTEVVLVPASSEAPLHATSPDTSVLVATPH